MRRLNVALFVGMVCIAALVALATAVDGGVSSGLTDVSAAEAREIWGGGQGTGFANDGCGTNLPAGCQTIVGQNASGQGNLVATAVQSCGGNCGNAATATATTE